MADVSQPDFAHWPEVIAHLKRLLQFTSNLGRDDIQQADAFNYMSWTLRASDENGLGIQRRRIACAQINTIIGETLKPMLEVMKDELIEAELKGKLPGQERMKLWRMVYLVQERARKIDRPEEWR